MAGSVQPFTPAGTVTVAATTTPAAVSFTTAGDGDTLLVTNAAAAVALITVNNTLVPVLPAAQVLFFVGALSTGATVALASGTGNVYLTLGTGTAY